MNITLSYHDYTYFPYEKSLAHREALSVLGGSIIQDTKSGVEICGGNINNADRLTYFSHVCQGDYKKETLQYRLERSVSAQKRQATRYSVHGLHEYKGKFNPQIVKALLNIGGVKRGTHVLDPFCGSGTTLVEAAQLGANAKGYDINPFAVYLANAKVLALNSTADFLEKTLDKIKANTGKNYNFTHQEDDRLTYLKKWFDTNVLKDIETVKALVVQESGKYAPIFLVLASNLLRDYSLQDPRDLRIRRRTSPLPTVPFTEAFLDECDKFVDKIRSSQSILGKLSGVAEATLQDNTKPRNYGAYDFAVTSPPYAMALPYIDTQRLSLVWLGLEQPDKISLLESTLVGSREWRGAKKVILEKLKANADDLPSEEFALCQRALDSLSDSDGFRRQAVPSLLYRYFVAMRSSFRTVFSDVKSGGVYMLVVGHNHTVLGGNRLDIDTPLHLASLAKSVGWIIEELVPLQTYQRWGYHAGNAVAAETLIILRRP